MNETLDLLLRHRSIRSYTEDPVPDEHVRAAVEAGQAASTSSAVQAYSLIRVRDPETREHLVELTGNQEKVAAAPSFFVVCADTRRFRLCARRYGQAHRARLELFLLSVIDASLFAQNMVVAFESLGYGICYIGGLRNHLSEVDRLLEIPEGVYPLFGLCVGRPAQDPLPRPRLPVEGVLFEERYPDDAAMEGLLDFHDERIAAYLERRGKDAVRWTQLMADRFTAPQRTDIAEYYTRKGADLT